MNTNVFSQTFRAPPGYPSKILGYPAQKVCFPGFEGHTELFGPHPFTWMPTRAPTTGPTRVDFPVFQPFKDSHESSHETPQVPTRVSTQVLEVHLSCFHLLLTLPEVVERCLPELPLSKLCSVPFSLQNKTHFEGEKRAKRCREKGRKRGGQQRGRKGKRTRENRSGSVRRPS